VLEFLLLAVLAGRSAGERFSAACEQRVAAMLEFLASLMDAGGNVPMIGDSDDGAVTRLTRTQTSVPYRSLLASGAILFGNSDLKFKAGKLDDKTRWLFGPAGRRAVQSTQRAARAAAPQAAAFPGGRLLRSGVRF